MFRLAPLMAALAFALTFQAHAEGATAESSTEVKSEFFHQADGGRFEVTPNLGASGTVVKFKGDTAKNTDSETLATQTLGTKAEYGITDNFAVGLNLDLKHTKLSYNRASGSTATAIPDQYARGLADPVIYFLGNNALPAGTIHYGFHLAWNLEDRRVNADGNQNAASGRKTLTPYIGYDITVAERHTFGAKLAYSVYQSDRTTDWGYNGNWIEKTTGGAKFDSYGFYEFTLNKHLTFGAEASFSVANGTSSNQTTDGPTSDDHNSYSSFGLALYVPWHATENITLLGRIYGGTQGNASSYQDVDYISTFGAGFGGRFAF